MLMLAVITYMVSHSFNEKGHAIPFNSNCVIKCCILFITYSFVTWNFFIPAAEEKRFQSEPLFILFFDMIVFEDYFGGYGWITKEKTG